MPSTETKLAWAVEVKVHKLGASLEAYDRLQPIFSALRLCNRFGHGERTAVNKLPVELIQQIEDVMMQQETNKTTLEWAHDFKCWQSDCEPIDHHTDAEILANYNVMHADLFQHGFTNSDDLCECCGVPGGAPVTEVTEEVRAWAAEDLKQMSYEGFCDWLESHDRRLKEWCKRVGKPTESSRGLFDKLGKVLERDFGLKVWLSHVQVPDAPERCQEDVAQSTRAYIFLPGSFSGKHLWDPLITSDDYGPTRHPTESGSAHAVKVPRKPSKASLARFDRALKTLGLKTVSDIQDSSCTEVTASAGNAKPHDTASRPAKTRSKPKLMMLIHNCDESEW